jgi:hypothetical protein
MDSDADPSIFIFDLQDAKISSFPVYYF